MAITHAAGLAATDAGAQAILCCTRSGRTAQAMARFRPAARLIGLSPNPATVRALALSWGITSLAIDTYSTTDEVVWFAVETAVHHGLVHSGEIVLVLAGAPDRPSGAATDVLRIVRVDVSGVWSEEAGSSGSPAGRPDPRLDGSVGGDAEAQPPARP